MSDSPPTRRRTVDPSPSGATRIVRPATPADEIPLATSAYAPRRSPGLVTGTPAFAPVPVEEPPAGLGPVQIGWSADRTSLAATSRAAIRPLETSSDVLPELVEAPEKARPLWRHPASIVSMITTFVALLALGAFIVFGLLNPGAAASGLALEVGDDNVRATWSGPDTPYQLVVVGGPGGDELDISQLVTGTEAWIPRSAGLIDERSCLVVRPAASEGEPVSLDADALAAQGATSACVAEAEGAPADE
jgi:hypothetical protein